MLRADGRFSHGCKCEICCEDRRRRELKRQKATRTRVARGIPADGMIDVEVARAVLKELTENRNWTLAAISDATGIDRRTLGRMRGTDRQRGDNYRRVYVAKFRKMEALLRQPARKKLFAGRVRATRLVFYSQCLMAEGYGRKEIAERIDCNWQYLSNVMRGKHEWCDPRLEIEARKMIEETGGRPGPSDFARRYAAKRGWRPAIAYDEFV